MNTTASAARVSVVGSRWARTVETGRLSEVEVPKFRCSASHSMLKYCSTSGRFSPYWASIWAS